MFMDDHVSSDSESETMPTTSRGDHVSSDSESETMPTTTSRDHHVLLTMPTTLRGDHISSDSESETMPTTSRGDHVLLTMPTTLRGDHISSSETVPTTFPIRLPNQIRSSSSPKLAYQFDGTGNVQCKKWDLSHGVGSVFNWYHFELSRKKNNRSLALSLLSVLRPQLKLDDVLMLLGQEPFCGNHNDALLFRIHSSGPISNDFTMRIAARVTKNCIITISLGRISRLGFEGLRRKKLLSLISMAVDDDNYKEARNDDEHDEEAEAGNDDEHDEEAEAGNDERLFDEVRNINLSEVDEDDEKAEAEAAEDERLLDVLLNMNLSEEGDRNVPNQVGDLLVHIVDALVHHFQHMTTKLEEEFNSLEIVSAGGDSMLKKGILDGGKCTKMLLNLHRLIQILGHGEQVFPLVKEKCCTEIWFGSEHVRAFEELIGRLGRLKGTLNCLVPRVTAVQTDLNTWQSKGTNRKVYYISVCTMIFVPSSIVLGVFGMNVGGLPWGEKNKHGFRNVMLLFFGFLIFLFLCFALPHAWKRRRALAGQLESQ